MRPFDGKRVLLGVSGSIAAYKAADLASKLTQAGALVDVAMTDAATKFVGPVTFRSVTCRPVLTDLFDLESDGAIEHIALAKAADVMVVAPATANMLYKLAHGQADDPISVIALATHAPLLVAPAMDGGMWEHPAVQANVESLRTRGVAFAGPAAGRMASGITGIGRLVETPELMGRIAPILGRSGALAGIGVVVSAGGTEEPIDPVRVVTNRSSGKMGYAIAEAARDSGATVTLVAAPTALPDPVGVTTVCVGTAAEMAEAVNEACSTARVLIMAAAVADYRPRSPRGEKIKKGDAASLTVEMEQTTDIIASAPKSLLRVGFAAESSDLLANALQKLESKGLDMVVVNDISRSDIGFGSDDNQVTLLARAGSPEELPLMSKQDVAWAIVDRIAALLR